MAIEIFLLIIVSPLLLHFMISYFVAHPIRFRHDIIKELGKIKDRK